MDHRTHRDLQGSVVDRWRGDGRTSYASPPVVCIASNVGDWGWLSERWTTAVAETHRNWLFASVHLAAYTGARRGELLNLRWRDVDLDAAEVRITGSNFQPWDP